MCRASEPVDEVVRRPRSRQLQQAIAHHGACGGKFVLVALHVLAVDQMGNVEHHLAIIGQAAAHFFVQRHEQPVHLEAHSAGAGLALPCPRGVLAQIGQVLAANGLRGRVLFQFFAAAVVDKDLQVHLGLAAQLVNVPKELPLVGADGLAQNFVVVKDRSKPEGKHGGMLEAVRDDPGVVYAGLLVEGF